MTGAITVAAVVGLLSLLAGVALGWHLRRTDEWCAGCAEVTAPRPAGQATSGSMASGS